MATILTSPLALTVGDLSDDGKHEVKLINGSNRWVLVPTVIAPSEIITSTTALTGAAPVGAKLGIDTTTGVNYHVVAGNWSAAPATVDLNTTVANVGVVFSLSGHTVPQFPPAGPTDIGDIHVELYEDATVYYRAIAANWTAPTQTVSNMIVNLPAGNVIVDTANFAAPTAPNALGITASNADLNGLLDVIENYNPVGSTLPTASATSYPYFTLHSQTPTTQNGLYARLTDGTLFWYIQAAS